MTSPHTRSGPHRQTSGDTIRWTDSSMAARAVRGGIVPAGGRRAVRLLAAGIALGVLGLGGVSARPAQAQELMPFTPAATSGTLYIGQPAAPVPEPGGFSVGVRLGESFPERSAGGASALLGVGGDPSMVPGLVPGGAIVDLYPFETGLRVSGGLRFGGELGSSEPLSAGAVTVGGATYPAAMVTAPDGADVDGVVPYVGVGYGTTLLGGAIDLSIDAGALTAVPGSSGLTINDRSGSTNPDIGSFLPMVGVSATYRF